MLAWFSSVSCENALLNIVSLGFVPDVLMVLGSFLFALCPPHTLSLPFVVSLALASIPRWNPPQPVPESQSSASLSPSLSFSSACARRLQRNPFNDSMSSNLSLRFGGGVSISVPIWFEGLFLGADQSVASHDYPFSRAPIRTFRGDSHDWKF